MLSDLGSTNGTFVEGERVSGEVPLGPGTTVKFGEVAVLFEPLDANVPVRRSSKTEVLSARIPGADGEPPAGDQPDTGARPRRPIRAAAPKPSGPSPIVIAAVVVLIAAAVAFFLLR
jgi:pSer/pThr/pTyr-binding forkhead associated (FHA) protein